MSEYGFGGMIQRLKASPKKIVFTEGTDPRILEAASRLLAGNFLHPILLGKEQEVYDAAEEAGFNIKGGTIIDPTNYDRFDEMVEMFCELRKSKGVTPEQAKGILSGAHGRIRKESHLRIDTKDLCALRCLAGDLYKLILCGIDIDRTVCHGKKLPVTGSGIPDKYET